MTKVDQFESVFRAAAKTVFRYQPVEVESILVVSDRDAEEALAFGERVRDLLAVLGDASPRWVVVHGGEYHSVPELLERVESQRPDLVCTYRHLHSDSWRWPYTLGEYVDVLTQVTTTPVLVLPHPERRAERAPTGTDVVMAMTDDLSGDARLVNWAARFTEDDGTLVLANVTDDAAFERFIDAVSRIPSIDTESARRHVLERLEEDARDYMGSCARVLAEAGVPVTVEEVVEVGRRLAQYRRLIQEREVDLLVMNTKDDDQMAMHGLAYPLAIEVRSIPLLLL